MTETRSLPLSRKILFYTVSLLLFAGLIEGGLSLLDRESIMVRGDDPRMVYSFYPLARGVASSREYRVEVDITEEGLRGCAPEKGEMAPSRTRKRIFFLGDSFTEGWGVECRESFAYRLRSGEREVFNGGIHGGTVSYYILRHRYYQERIRPDTVVIQLFDNDLDDLDKVAPFLVRDDRGRVQKANPAGLLFLPPGPFSRFIKESMTYRTVKRIVGLVRGRPVPIKYYKPGRAPDGKILTHQQALQELGAPDPLKDPRKEYGGQFFFYTKGPGESLEPLWESRFERMERYLSQLLEEIRRDAPHTKVVFLYIPAMESFVPGGILGRYRDGRGELRRATPEELKRDNRFYHLLEKVAGEKGATLVDGQTVLYQDAEALYFPGDAHLNGKGHERVARALERVL